MTSLACYSQSPYYNKLQKIVETLHPLGVLLFTYYLSHCNPLPPSPLSVLLAKQKKLLQIKRLTLKGGQGKGSGKALNSWYGGYWKLEKVFFNGSVSTILQLVVVMLKLRRRLSIILSDAYQKVQCIYSYAFLDKCGVSFSCPLIQQGLILALLLSFLAGQWSKGSNQCYHF